jgi:H+-transporting ATPase
LTPKFDIPTFRAISVNQVTAGEQSQGLTAGEAASRLEKFGPNEIAETRKHPFLGLMRKFWSPVPWMLEVTIILQTLLGKIDEAAVIAALLVLNAILSFFQEDRANKALALLRTRLDVIARVKRDSAWSVIQARKLVPGDVVHIRMGDFVPADLELIEGQVQLDQSTLTGESLPVEAGAGAMAFSGAVVTRGEASGVVRATGGATRFGKTAELMRVAKTSSHLEQTIFKIVKYLVYLDIVLVVALLLYAAVTGLRIAEVIPFALILLIASVPVALPATFTLATALGAVELARRGVLVTRLSAIEEAAGMDVLASDKTGTITENKLSLFALRPYGACSEAQLLGWAALASDHATQDPIDLAILAQAHDPVLAGSGYRDVRFIPFDPHTRRSERIFEKDGAVFRVIKGAAKEIAAAAGVEIAVLADELAAQGCRVLGVAVGDQETLQFAGLVALMDPPRHDSAQLIEDLKQLGIRVVMVTGDGEATARNVAAAVGIGDRICPATLIEQNPHEAITRCDVFAQVFPADKFHLVEAFQRSGHVTGMTGDGVNDAPALKQAEVGIAVANATDVAKAAASLVFTNPGLSDLVATIETSRRIYQRMLTYTLNKIMKTLEIAIFMSVGVMVSGVFVITPLSIVLLLFTNDFVTMSIATDRVDFSRKPERWDVATLMMTAAPLAGMVLILSFSVFFAGRDILHLPLPQLQTLVFLMLVFTGLGNVFLVRERGHFWRSMPSRWLLVATAADLAVVMTMAQQGILMAPLDPQLIGAMLLLALAYLVLMDFVKLRIFKRFGFTRVSS